MTQLATISYANHKFEYILKDGEPWFRAKSVATMLESKNTDQTIRTHVHQDDRRKYSELQDGVVVFIHSTYIDHNLMNSIFINESGLYSLIMRSKKQDARQFQQWVTKEVLPSIRKNGSYSLTSAQLAIEPPKYFTQEIEDIKKKKILVINNETSLHEQVVRFIRSNFPDAVIDGTR